MPPVEPFSVSRVFDAPRKLVYEVCTKPEHMQQWMGPAGFECVHSEMDLRVGGRYHYGLRGPNGIEMWGRQIFREIEPERKLVYIQSFSDAEGGLTRHPMSPAWPLEMLATLTFVDEGPNRTRLTISWQPYNSDAAGESAFDGSRGSMQQGFRGMLDKLESHVRSLS